MSDSVDHVISELKLKKNRRHIYHGSPAKFDIPKSTHSPRMSEEGAIVWDGEAIFATYDRRIALKYTANRIKGYSTGVSLVDEIKANGPMRLIILGGSNKQDALDKLYGTGNEADSTGYLYIMEGVIFFGNKVRFPHQFDHLIHSKSIT